MTYYLAVWEGPAPLSNVHAASEFQRRWEARGHGEASPLVTDFVEELVSILPDIDEPDQEDGPWADGPLLNCADAAGVFLPVRSERLGEVLAHVDDLARYRELVAYDPQRNQLVPSATSEARRAQFELPSPEELPLHLGAVIGEAVATGGSMAGTVQEDGSMFYVQWLVEGGTLTIEAQGERMLPEHLRLDPDGRARMTALGFVEGDPNWSIRWPDATAGAQDASVLLARVLTEVRGFPVGSAMTLQTFPIPD